jgi:hypothetical protein
MGAVLNTDRAEEAARLVEPSRIDPQKSAKANGTIVLDQKVVSANIAMDDSLGMNISYCLDCLGRPSKYSLVNN